MSNAVQLKAVQSHASASSPSLVNPTLTAMSWLWFREVMEQSDGGYSSLNMDQNILAYAALNPLDGLRLLIQTTEDEGLNWDDAAAICEVDESEFSTEMPTLGREACERSLGRLALCLFASMRNEWRRQHGRPESEMEDVMGAVDSFFAVAGSSVRPRFRE